MTSQRPDLYAILGVAPSATQAEISHAYRALLRQHHPDTRAAIDGPNDVVSDQALQHVLAGAQTNRRGITGAYSFRPD